MNNKELYIDVISRIQPSEDVIERIMDMTNQNTKKRIKLTPALATIICLVILVTGVFGGSAISAKLNPIIKADDFVITAYANNKAINLSDDKATKTDLKLALVQGESGNYDTVEEHWDVAFRVDGKSVKAATYSAERGGFSYHSLYGNDYVDGKIEHGYISGKPYSSKITIDNIDNKECVELFYNADEAIDILIKSQNPNYDYSTLPSDTITVLVEFNDGSKAEKSINISFDKNGYLLMQYVD